MVDQHGNPVPDDLVVLEDDAIRHLEAEELEAIDKLAWYKVPKFPYILVSWDALEKAVELPIFVSDPVDVALTLDHVEYINQNLHRYNEADGWYHA